MVHSLTLVILYKGGERKSYRESSGWKPTNLTSVFSLGTSILSLPDGTTLMAFTDVRGCQIGWFPPTPVREPKSYMGQVFSFKLGHLVMHAFARHIQACLSLELKTQPRFHPVSLSLPMIRARGRGVKQSFWVFSARQLYKTKDQCYKTFYSHNLQIFILSQNKRVLLASLSSLV